MLVRRPEASLRRLSQHAWIAILALAAVTCTQAWRAERQHPETEVTAAWAIGRTATGQLVGEVPADARVRNDASFLGGTISGSGKGARTQRSAVFALLALLAVVIGTIGGLASGLVEAVTAPRPGWKTILARSALVLAWMAPLVWSAGQRQGTATTDVAGLATVVVVLAAISHVHALPVAAVRVAALGALVWLAAGPVAGLADTAPAEPYLGDIERYGRVIRHDGPMPAQAPTDDWSAPGDDALPQPGRVVVIVVDTLGANHMSTYGYEEETMPRLDEMARREGIVFEHNQSSAPWTLPSTTSLFTSMHPHQHGVEDDGRRLHEDVPTLAGAFSTQGWTTAALVTHLYVSSKFGLDSGFGEFWELSIDFNFGAGHQLIAEQLAARTRIWLEEHADEQFLLYVHFFDPHWDYEPPPPFDEMFADPSYDGPADGTWQYMSRFMSTSRLMRPDALAECTALYDGEIAYTDEHIGRIFDSMRELGIWDDAMVVVMSDHGEELQEHRSVGHARTVYEELVWVPLVVKPPGGRPDGWRSHVDQQTRSVDVAPTLLDVAGLRTPPDFAGRSLVPLMRGTGPHRDTFSRTLRQRRNKATVTHNRWKLIRNVGRDEEELYDLEGDPLEQRNVLEDHPEIAADLRRRLDAVLEDPGGSGAGQRFVEDVELSDAEREALEALGYVQ